METDFTKGWVMRFGGSRHIRLLRCQTEGCDDSILGLVLGRGFRVLVRQCLAVWYARWVACGRQSLRMEWLGKGLLNGDNTGESHVCLAKPEWWASMDEIIERYEAVDSEHRWLSWELSDWFIWPAYSGIVIDDGFLAVLARDIDGQVLESETLDYLLPLMED